MLPVVPPVETMILVFRRLVSVEVAQIPIVRRIHIALRTRVSQMIISQGTQIVLAQRRCQQLNTPTAPCSVLRANKLIRKVSASVPILHKGYLTGSVCRVIRAMLIPRMDPVPVITERLIPNMAVSSVVSVLVKWLWEGNVFARKEPLS